MAKAGLCKRYAFVAADYGSIDAEFFLNGKKYVTPQGVAHYLEHKMFDLPEGTPCRSSPNTPARTTPLRATP